MKEKVVVTGAAGFAGAHITKKLIENGYFVYAVVRKGSLHNSRLDFPKESIKLIELADNDYSTIPALIDDVCKYFFHFALRLGIDRNDINTYYYNGADMNAVVHSAVILGCKKFIGVGSQAEYGIVNDLICENRCPDPFSMYGAEKVASLYMSKSQATIEGIEWNWGRIFSLIGEYEPSGRLIPDIIDKMKLGETFNLSAATQYWDYLDADDCAEAFIAIAERGKNGEIYNVANGDSHPLKEFMEKLKKMYGVESSKIAYGAEANPRVSLKPDVSKIKKDIGWNANKSFESTIKRVYG